MRTGNHLARPQQGFTFLGVLFLVTVMGASLAGVGQLWSVSSQRAKERELLWVGTQYARALRSYYRNSPGTAAYPRHLEELLEDRRSVVPKRHLRRLYPDPMTGSQDWGLVMSYGEGIAGVYSRSERSSMKRSNFPPQWQTFEGLERVADWQFVAEDAFADSQSTAQPLAAPGGNP